MFYKDKDLRGSNFEIGTKIKIVLLFMGKNIVNPKINICTILKIKLTFRLYNSKVIKKNEIFIFQKIIQKSIVVQKEIPEKKFAKINDANMKCYSVQI